MKHAGREPSGLLPFAFYLLPSTFCPSFYLPALNSFVLIAIDGPAASGKSSVAHTLAHRLGYGYVNSGGMYRAVTWHALERGVDPADASAVAGLLAAADMTCGFDARGDSFLRLGGVDPEAYLRDAGINDHVSAVASVPAVRALLTGLLRDLAAGRDTVMEGRDIGSAVFPQTPYKFYIDASPEVRAQRRAAQGDSGRDEIAARDRIDSTRRTSPLVIAEDAHVIDSSRLTIDGVVGEVIGRLKIKGLQLAQKPSAP